MLKIKLRCLKSNHITTDIEIKGTTSRLPVIGYTFMLHQGEFKYFQTTRVLTIESIGNEHTFTTRNSTYHLTVIE